MKTAYAKYISSLLLFGSNGILASYVLLKSHDVVMWRSLIGSLFLIVVFTFGGGKLHVRKNPKHFMFTLISGAALGISWIFLFEAYSQIGVSLASLAYYSGPVIVIALSPLIFRERLTKVKITGLALVLLGMIFVNGQDLWQSGLNWGLFCGLSAAVLYAVMIIFNKKATDITGLENTMIQLFASFLAVGIYTIIKHGAVSAVSADSLLPLLCLGLVNTGAGCYLYFSSIDRLSAGTVSIIGYLEPLSALIFSAAFLDERLTALQWAGAALILSGAVFSEVFSVRKLEKEKKVSAARDLVPGV